jgi:hypothetical protein
VTFRHPRRDLFAAAEAESPLNAQDVGANCRKGETEPSGDQDVLQAVSDELGDLVLALSQPPDGGVGRQRGARPAGIVVGLSHTCTNARMGPRGPLSAPAARTRGKRLLTRHRGKPLGVTWIGVQANRQVPEWLHLGGDPAGVLQRGQTSTEVAQTHPELLAQALERPGENGAILGEHFQDVSLPSDTPCCRDIAWRRHAWSQRCADV